MSGYTQQDVKALKERRKLSGITARELYEVAGLSCTQYASIENGKATPTTQEWGMIEFAFKAIDQKRAFDQNKWLFSGTEDQTEARRKLARWNAAAKRGDE